MTSRAAATPEPDLPRWAIERVTVVPADPSWTEQGERECALLRQCLEPWLIAGVHHVGSTAVPGLRAKPIIDVMAGVASLDDLIGVADALGADWHYVPPELDEYPWRRFYIRVQHDHRAAHLHLMQPSAPRWRQQLAFRDALRRDRVLAAEYGILKQELAGRHGDDREAYTKGKTVFVSHVLGEDIV